MRSCECGSTNILHGTFVLCRDCRRRTRSYQLTTGEYQSEAAAALSDWHKRRYETEEEKQKRENFEQWLVDYEKKKKSEKIHMEAT